MVLIIRIFFYYEYTVASRALCTNQIHLTKALQQIINDEGEGVILRKPNSEYEHGRSTALLKLKVCGKG